MHHVSLIKNYNVHVCIRYFELRECCCFNDWPVYDFINILVQINISEATQLSRIVRKPEFRLCENKGADQLRSNCEADQRLCFRHSDSTISLLPNSEISRF